METIANTRLSALCLAHFVLELTGDARKTSKWIGTWERNVLTHSFSVLTLLKSQGSIFSYYISMYQKFYDGLDFTKAVQCFKKCFEGLFYTPWVRHQRWKHPLKLSDVFRGIEETIIAFSKTQNVTKTMVPRFSYVNNILWECGNKLVKN